MKTLIKILLIAFVNLSLFSHISYAATTDTLNLKTWSDNWVNSAVKYNEPLQDLKNSETDYVIQKWWQQWIYNTLIRIARDLKNLFFIISWLYFLILVIKLLFAEKTDEEVSNFKKWIIWISIWIVITQLAYYFINVVFDKSIDATLAKNFIDIIIQPLINLLSVAASFFFLAIMVYAFYRLVTANWDEEAAKTWKMSVLYAMIWFIVIKLSNLLVKTTYWETYCYSHICEDRVTKTDLTWFIKIITDIINWANWFIWLIVVIMIIYAWFLTLTSLWDEEKLKKSKSIIIYIAVWLFILFANYLILTFFIIPETII